MMITNGFPSGPHWTFWTFWVRQVPAVDYMIEGFVILMEQGSGAVVDYKQRSGRKL